MSQPFNKEQLAYLKQLMTNRNKSLRHEVSDHLDNALPVKKLKGHTGPASLESDADGNTNWVEADSSLYIPKSIIDAKGDLIVGTASDTPARKAMGADKSILVAEAAQADGMKWSPNEIITGVQSGTFSSTATWHDLCSVTVGAGVWLFVGNCSSARVWHNGAGPVVATFIASIRVGGVERARSTFSIVSMQEQRTEGGRTVSIVLDLASTTTVYLSGYYIFINLIGGANFASGFRTDSGSGLQNNAVIQATRLR